LATMSLTKKRKRLYERILKCDKEKIEKMKVLIKRRK